MKGRILIISLILLVLVSPLAGALVPDDELYPADDLYPSEIPDVEFTISANVTTITESNTEILLTVWKNQTGDDINSTIEINTTDGSAIAGADYIAINENLTFEQNETNKTVVLSIKANSYGTFPKTFRVTLDDPTNNATLGSPYYVDITITANPSHATGQQGLGALTNSLLAVIGVFFLVFILAIIGVGLFVLGSSIMGDGRGASQGMSMLPGILISVVMGIILIVVLIVLIAAIVQIGGYGI